MNAMMSFQELMQSAGQTPAPKITQSLRLAILADSDVQFLARALTALAARRGIALEVYRGDIDVFEAEVAQADSGLYRFKPDVTLFALSSQAVKEAFYQTPDRADFAGQMGHRFAGLWDCYAKHTAVPLIQTNLARPVERAFGNYELLAKDSLGSAICALNAALVRGAAARANVLLCDVDYLAASLGLGAWYDDRMWGLARTFCALDALPALAAQVLDCALAARGQIVKCVAVDLDGTLWGGVVGEDGVGALRIGPSDDGASFLGFHRFLLELKRRGILLAAISKNDEAVARAPFREHPHMALKESDFAIFLANWQDKATNMQQVIQTLNIDPGAIVFIDDNAFERHLVRSMCPGVIVPEMPEDSALFLPHLASLNLFETASTSSLGEARTQMIQTEAQRATTRAAFPDVTDYLASLEMRAQVEPLGPATLARFHALAQRSNQANLTTRRTSLAQFEMMARAPNILPLAVFLKDRFGDYGLVAGAVLKFEDEAALVDELFISCRVFQRGLEDWLMNKLVEAAKARGAAQIKGLFRPSEKNSRFADFYARRGFALLDGKEGEEVWGCALDTYMPLPTPIKDEGGVR